MPNPVWLTRTKLAVIGALFLLASSLALALEEGIPFEPGDEERWILIDTNSYVLTVYKGMRPVANFHNLAIGQSGTARTRREGDKTTPLGEFKIDYISHQSRHHRFLGINYPTPEKALLAWQEGTISFPEYLKYLDQRRALGRPPQQTALGGMIGIHGVGAGNVRLHRIANWTDGCIALEDDQIDALSRTIEIGTRVYIR